MCKESAFEGIPELFKYFMVILNLILDCPWLAGVTDALIEAYK